MIGTSKRDLVLQRIESDARASGLFDEAYYRATYGVSPEVDAWRYFCDKGHIVGHRPSEKFDPAYYRAITPDCGSSNPLWHFLTRGLPDLPPLSEFAAPLIGQYSREIDVGKRDTTIKPRTLREQIDFLPRVAQAGMQSAEIDGLRYGIEVPPLGLFFDLLRRDASFAFARLTHGFWDGIVVRDRIAANDLFNANLPEERLAFATRVALLARSRQACYAEGFYEELWPLIERNRTDPDFFNAIAFKGFPKPDEQLFNPGAGYEERAVRLRLLSKYFSPDDRLIDGTYWKRLAFSGDLESLPDLIRRRHVIIVGPEFTSPLGAALRLSHCDHVVIPRTHVHRERRTLLSRISSLLADSVCAGDGKPVVLLQCGSLAYWLIAKLYQAFPNAVYLDLGQALNIWLPEGSDVPLFEWYLIYRALREHRLKTGRTR